MGDKKSVYISLEIAERKLEELIETFKTYYSGSLDAELYKKKTKGSDNPFYKRLAEDSKKIHDTRDKLISESWFRKYFDETTAGKRNFYPSAKVDLDLLIKLYNQKKDKKKEVKKTSYVSIKNIIVIDLLLVIVFFCVLFFQSIFVESNKDYFDFTNRKLIRMSDSENGIFKVNIDSAGSGESIKFSIRINNKDNKDIRDNYVRLRYFKESGDSTLRVKAIIYSEDRKSISDEVLLVNLPKNRRIITNISDIVLRYRNNKDTVLIKQDIGAKHYDLLTKGIYLRDFLPKDTSNEMPINSVNGYINLSIAIRNTNPSKREKIKGAFDLNPRGGNLGFTYFQVGKNYYDKLIANIDQPEDYQFFKVAVHIKNLGNTDIPNMYVKTHFKEKGTDSITNIEGVLYSSELGDFKDSVSITNLPASWELELVSARLGSIHSCSAYSWNGDITHKKYLQNLKTNGFNLGTLTGVETHSFNGEKYEHQSCTNGYLLADFSLKNTVPTN